MICLKKIFFKYMQRKEPKTQMGIKWIWSWRNCCSVFPFYSLLLLNTVEVWETETSSPSSLFGQLKERKYSIGISVDVCRLYWHCSNPSGKSFSFRCLLLKSAHVFKAASSLTSLQLPQSTTCPITFYFLFTGTMSCNLKLSYKLLSGLHHPC